MVKRHFGAIGLVGAVLAVGLVSTWMPGDTPDPHCRFDRNAAWIDVDWTSKPVDPSAVRDLANRTTERKIFYLFPFTTFVRQDGSFSPSFGHAGEFVRAFRALNQQALLFAWIGIPLKNERAIGLQGWVDLQDPMTRRKIVNAAVDLVHGSGFDGVHLDAETVRDSDQTFLLLLDEMRNALGDSKISIAGNHWAPTPLQVLPVIKDAMWSGDYYRQVAKRVDQIAVMTYDSFAPSGILYRIWMREQVRGISASLGPSNVELLVGASVSREETWSHHPGAENLNDALAGLCAGAREARGIVQGVAIYAEWEFSETDQAIWNAWLQ